MSVDYIKTRVGGIFPEWTLKALIVQNKVFFFAEI